MSTTLLMSWFCYSESKPSLSRCAAGEPKPGLDSELAEKFALDLVCNPTRISTRKIREVQPMFRDGSIFSGIFLIFPGFRFKLQRKRNTAGTFCGRKKLVGDRVELDKCLLWIDVRHSCSGVEVALARDIEALLFGTGAVVCMRDRGFHQRAR
jgi:hypothetical protein